MNDTDGFSENSKKGTYRSKDC